MVRNLAPPAAPDSGSPATQSHCPVSATEDASWIEIASAPKFGSGEIVIRVDENTSDDERSAPITITDESFLYVITVIQEGKD